MYSTARFGSTPWKGNKKKYFALKGQRESATQKFTTLLCPTHSQNGSYVWKEESCAKCDTRNSLKEGSCYKERGVSSRAPRNSISNVRISHRYSVWKVIAIMNKSRLSLSSCCIWVIYGEDKSYDMSSVLTSSHSQTAITRHRKMELVRLFCCGSVFFFLFKLTYVAFSGKECALRHRKCFGKWWRSVVFVIHQWVLANLRKFV